MNFLSSCLAGNVLPFLQAFQAFKSLIFPILLLAGNVLPLLGFAGILKFDFLCYYLAENVLSFLQTLQAFKSLIFLY